MPRWTQKPPPGTDLDRTNPYCPDHCWPFLSPQGTAQCLTRGARLKAPSTLGDIYAGSSSFVPGRKYGAAVRHGATSDVLCLTANDATELDKVIPFSGGWTILLCQRKTDATLRAAGAIGATGTGADSCQLDLPFSDGSAYFDYGGFVSGTTRLVVAGLTYGDDLWVATTGPRGMELWQNGILRGSNSANPTRTSSGTQRFSVPGIVTNVTDLADTSLVMTWRRQLSASAIQALSSNPWQVFERHSFVFGEAAGSAGAGTAAGAATASAIGGNLQSGVGSAAGAATASGVGSTGINHVDGVGSAAGAATALGVGVSSGAGIGSAIGTSSATAVGRSVKASQGLSTGSSTAVARGADATATLACTTLSPVYTDDEWGNPLTYLWEQTAGFGLATIDSPTSPSTGVCFPAHPGTYLFRITVSNGTFTGIGYWRVTVLHGAIPVVEDVAATTITINGVDYDAIIQSTSINEQLSAQPNTASFKIFGIDIPEGADVVIHHGSAGILFAGTVMTVKASTYELPENQFYDVQINGYEWRMGRRQIDKTYTETSITDIAVDLVGLVPGFTTGGIEPGLPTIRELTLKGSVPQALQTLAGLIPGGHWKVGYDKDVFLGTEDRGVVQPDPVTVTNEDIRDWSSARDISRVVNRLIVTGQSPSVSIDESNGIQPHEVEVESLDNYSSSGGEAVLNGQKFTYTGTATRMVGSVFGRVQITGFTFTPQTLQNGQLQLWAGYTYQLTLSTRNGETPMIAGYVGTFLRETQNSFHLRLENQLTGMYRFVLDTTGDYQDLVKSITGINVYRDCHFDGRIKRVTTFTMSGGVYDDTLSDSEELTFHPEIPYLDTSGVKKYFLTGVSGLTSSTKTVDGVKYTFPVNDTASQAILAAKFGVGDDGVIEDSFDAGIVPREQAEKAAVAFIEERNEIDLRVQWKTSDYKALVGCSVSISLGDARNVIGDFKIQQRTVSNFESGVSPWYVVTATKKLSLVRFESLLGR